MKKITFALLTLVLLAACNPAPASPTATPVDVDALKTQAVQTVIAEVTQTAEAMPTATATDVPPTATEAPTQPSQTPLASPTSNLTPTANICDASAFVADVTFPDNTQVEPGAQFQKTWRFKNIGSCRWTRAYTIRFAYGERMNASAVYLEAEVEPGAEADISVLLTAPTKPGTYKGYWSMFSNNGYQFGEYVSVIIVVP